MFFLEFVIVIVCSSQVSKLVGLVYGFICMCVCTLTLSLLGCSGIQAMAAGICVAVRRLLIGCFMLLSERLYCCGSQRKSRGEQIISQLIPTLLISHHSLPQPLIYRRVNLVSLFSLFLVTNTLFPLLLLFRIDQHYHHSFPEELNIGQRKNKERESTCCEIPRRRWWHVFFPHTQGTQDDGEAWKGNKLSSPHCTRL